MTSVAGTLGFVMFSSESPVMISSYEEFCTPTLMGGRVVETVSRPLTNISPLAKNESLSAQRLYEMVLKCLSVIVCARAKSYKSPLSMQTYKVNKQ